MPASRRGRWPHSAPPTFDAPYKARHTRPAAKRKSSRQRSLPAQRLYSVPFRSLDYHIASNTEAILPHSRNIPQNYGKYSILPDTKGQKRQAIGQKGNVSRLGAELTAALGSPAKSVPCLCRDGCAVRLSALPATLLYFQADEAVRCIGHRSVLHRLSQRAASAIAPCCILHESPMPFSPCTPLLGNPTRQPVPVCMLLL